LRQNEKFLSAVHQNMVVNTLVEIDATPCVSLASSFFLQFGTVLSSKVGNHNFENWKMKLKVLACFFDYF
jgi:hypothetical protein